MTARATAANGDARCALVADLGASSLRVAVIDETGVTRAFAARPLDTASPAPGWREQDAGKWWHDFGALVREVLDAHPAPPHAVVISGGARTQVLADRDGEPVRPAIMWDDSRATAEAGRLAARFDLPGNPITAYHPAARLAWLAAHEPAHVARARALLQPKDFLVRRLTGTACADPVSCWMLLDDDGWMASLAGATGFPVDLLPPLHEPGAVVGEVLQGPGIDPRLAGVPVLCGAMDTWCCALALGAYRDGALYDLSGTSEVVGAISARRLVRDGLLTVPWGDGLWHLGGPSQCGGRTVNWARGVLGMTDGTLDSHVASHGGRADAPLFVPYLDGERTPWWDESLSGAWLQVRQAHRRADLMFAVVEGIAFHVRAILEAAGDAAPPTEVLVAGGGLARSDAWCQARADVTGRTVIRSAAAEPGLAGAAMLAMTGLSWCDSLDQARTGVAGEAGRFTPHEDERETVDVRYARFLAYARNRQPS